MKQNEFEGMRIQG